MTREEVITVLQKIKPIPCRADGKSTTHTLVTIALDMAIKALEQQPNLQPTCNQLATDCISRQAALCLKTIAPIAPVMDGEAVHYEEVIFARDLEKLPSIESEKCGDCTEHPCLGKLCIYYKQPCGDYIRRRDVLDLAKSGKLVSNGNYKSVCDAINELPSVEPEGKTGKWVHMVGWWECNQCHAEYTGMPTCMGKVIYEYCPMCGAGIKGAEDDG